LDLDVRFAVKGEDVAVCNGKTDSFQINNVRGVHSIRFNGLDLHYRPSQVMIDKDTARIEVAWNSYEFRKAFFQQAKLAEAQSVPGKKLKASDRALTRFELEQCRLPLDEPIRIDFYDDKGLVLQMHPIYLTIDDSDRYQAAEKLD